MTLASDRVNTPPPAVEPGDILSGGTSGRPWSPDALREASLDAGLDPDDVIAESDARYQVHEVAPGDVADYSPKGGNKTFMYAHENEVMVSGPSETGKTIGACFKLHLLAIKYPGLQGAIVRKTKESMYSSVLQTFDRVIAGAGVTVYGNKKVERYIYPNGSVYWVGGMDKPAKMLSSERDIIYVNQAEELNEDEWETLTTRTTGRGAIIPHPQLIGDCNPGPPKHWIIQRAERGSLRLIPTTHRDNPTLFNEDGSLTERGVRTMGVLDKLTGVRRLRLLLGQWAAAEGTVYDTFDRNVHVRSRFPDVMVSWYLALDDGYTNPAVILRIGEDPDGRWHIFEEFYQTGYIQDDVAEEAKKMHARTPVRLAAVDSAAPGLVEALRKKGVPATSAKGKLLPGIRKIQDRLKVQPDGKPRLTVDPSCINTINEFESYVWMKNRDEPIDAHNHSLGAVRYLQDAMDGDTGEQEVGENPFGDWRG